MLDRKPPNPRPLNPYCRPKTPKAFQPPLAEPLWMLLRAVFRQGMGGLSFGEASEMAEIPRGRSCRLRLVKARGSAMSR